MNSNVLAKFEYNGKTYVYYVMLDKPKNLLYGYLENDVIKEVTDPKDVSIMQEAYKKIFISSDPNNHIKLTTTKNNGKLFQIMYDKVTGLKFFYEIKDGKYYKPSVEDSIELFNMFNKTELYNEINQNSDKDDKTQKNNKKQEIFTKILIFIQTINCFVMLGSVVYEEYILPNYPLSSIVQTVNSFSSGSKIEFSADKIKEAINSNPNLSDDEKTFFLEEIPYLVKNQKYVDTDDLIHRLKTSKIQYYQTPGKNMLGCYNPFLNNQKIFNSTNFADAPKDVLRHETRHNVSKAHSSFGPGVYEATTEIISYEYGYNNYYSYLENVAYQKILYEIIGTEPFVAYEESGDFTYIVRALNNLIPDQRLAVELISDLDSIISYGQEKGKYYDYNLNDYTNKNKVREIDENLSQCHFNIYNILNRYFEASKGYPMSCDILCLEILNQINPYIGFANCELSISIDGGKTAMPVTGIDYTKGFFLDDFIEKNPYYSIYFEGLRDYLIGYKENGDPIYLKAPSKMELPIVDGINRQLSYASNTLLVDSKCVISDEIIFGNGIFNGLNELVREEKDFYSSQSFYRYKEQSTYIKMLCEIIGTEPFENYLKSGDINEILASLYNIIPDKEKALRLIGYIDVTSMYYEQQTKDIDLNDPDLEVMPGDVDQNLYDIRSEIYIELSSYFSEAKGYNLNEDIIMNSYYSKLIENFNFDCCQHVWPVSFVFGNGSTADADDYDVKIIFKAYFNEELKENYKNPYLMVQFIPKNSDDGEFEEKVIYITDDNRQMESIMNSGADGTNHYEFKGTDNLEKIQGKI